MSQFFPVDTKIIVVRKMKDGKTKKNVRSLANLLKTPVTENTEGFVLSERSIGVFVSKHYKMEEVESLGLELVEK